MLDRFFQARNPLPGEQLHARRPLELGEFLLEREQAQAAGGNFGGVFARCQPSLRLMRTCAIRFSLRSGWLLDWERCRRGRGSLQRTPQLIRRWRVLRVAWLLLLASYSIVARLESSVLFQQPGKGFSR